MQRYFTDNVKPFMPYRGTGWLRLFAWFADFYRRKSLDVHRLEYRGVDLLRASFDRKAGCILAANHWSFSDGAMVGSLAYAAGRFVYYMISYHLFRQSRLRAWALRRLGNYSILREGSDRESMRTSVQLLCDADRPIVMFPEGTWYRQNDRLGPMQEGVAFIAQMAARQAQRPIVIHPIGLKYWPLKDPRPAMNAALDEVEKSLGLTTGVRDDFVNRIERCTVAWIAACESQLLGRQLSGTGPERRDQLIAEVLRQVECEEFGKEQTGGTMERIRRARMSKVKKLVGDPVDVQKANAALDRLYQAELLFGQSFDYLPSHPTLERQYESVLRLQETVTDEYADPLVPMGVVAEAGPAIEVIPGGQPGALSRDDLTAAMAREIQGILNRLSAEGPPKAWKLTWHQSTSV